MTYEPGDIVLININPITPGRIVRKVSGDAHYHYNRYTISNKDMYLGPFPLLDHSVISENWILRKCSDDEIADFAMKKIEGKNIETIVG